MGWRSPSRQASVTRLSRDRRAPPRWGMGLPPRRPRRWWHRIADPRIYLKFVMLIAGAALVALPLAADAVNALARPASGPGENCRILSVVDGDTVTMWCGTRGVERARITGFDTPELFSPGCNRELALAWQAKWALRLAIWQADALTIRREGSDRYGRTLVSVQVDGAPIGQSLIAQGLARPYGGGRRQGWCG